MIPRNCLQCSAVAPRRARPWRNRASKLSTPAREHIATWEVLSQPTASFREHAVIAWIREWAPRHGLVFRQDGAGNVILECARRRPVRRSAPHWVYIAHLDHPGFVVRRQRARCVWAEFRGHVAERYFHGARVRFFAPDGEVGAVITAPTPRPGDTFPVYRLRLERGLRVPAGSIGLWDVGPVRWRGPILQACTCDDVAGSAAVLTAMAQLARRPPPARVTAVLTRAEESGFVGALWAVRHGTIPPRAFVISVEASKARPGARLGAGAVIRVGDRAAVFDPALTAHLTAVAKEVAHRQPRLRYTRQLMDGGVCEAAVLQAYGRRVAGLSLPLGNYHNMGPHGRLRAEQVHRGDFAALVALLVALPRHKLTPADTAARFKRQLNRLLREREHWFQDAADRGPGHQLQCGP